MARGFLRTYLFSTDHKTIAKQYLFTGLFFLLVAGSLAMLIRWQLAYPGHPFPLGGRFLFGGDGAVTDASYLKLFTMHGAIMVFFAITPIVLGALGNYVVPLEIGARDMAFPRLNMLSYWFLFTGGAVIVSSFFLPGGAAESGWRMYAPLSSNTLMTGNLGQDFLILGLALDAASIMAGGVNFLATILNLRTKGMGLMRMPLTVWGIFFSSVLNTLWLPIVVAALFMVLADRHLGTAFFAAGKLAPHEGGQPLLYQHLFWGFGHPEVYILIFPVWGLVGDLLSTFSRKPAFGYRATVLSMTAITILSGFVWAHHMFTSGINPLIGYAFVFLTISISIPTAVFFLNWLATLWKGSIRFEVPMLYALGIVFVFAVGGLTGLFNAMRTFDIYIHNTYFVVGHFHYTLAASVLFGVFAFVYFWFPKMFGRRMNPLLGKLHFWLTFVFLNGVFFSMMRLGLAGHPRWISNPTMYEYLAPYQSWNVFASWSAFALGTTQLLFMINFFWSLAFGEPAPANPWECSTLAWSVPSPPPEHNFDAAPLVRRGPHEYSSPQADALGRDWVGQSEACETKA